ncbi:MAG: hypothetical protein ACKORJ_12665 [Bacteroidota bacterium]
MKCIRMMLLIVAVMFMADQAANAQSSYLKNRQAFNRYRYGRATKTYHRACAILERKHSPPRSIFALFRKRSRRIAEGGS